MDNNRETARTKPLRPLQLNPTLESLPAFPFVRLDELRDSMRERGETLFDFGTGDPREPTDPKILRALQESAPPVSQYPVVPGKRELRRSFCDWLQRRHGVHLDPETEALPANGSKEAIFHAPFAFLHPSQARKGVAYGTPGYPVYERGTLFAGGEVLTVRLRPEDGFLLNPEAVDPQRTRILWINYPHNPTGATASREYLEEVVEYCHRHDILLFSDECYNEIYSGEPPPSALEVSTERVVAFVSLSKRSGMTGYRTGMMAGDAEVIGALRRLRPSIGVASPEFVQNAAIAAWSDDEHVRERREVFGAKRELFTAFLDRARIEYQPTDASFYLWVAAPGGDDAAYALRLLEEGIIVAPGRGFGPGGEGFVRVALVPGLEDCRRAIERWEGVAG